MVEKKMFQNWKTFSAAQVFNWVRSPERHRRPYVTLRCTIPSLKPFSYVGFLLSKPTHKSGRPWLHCPSRQQRRPSIPLVKGRRSTVELPGKQSYKNSVANLNENLYNINMKNIKFLFHMVWIRILKEIGRPEYWADISGKLVLDVFRHRWTGRYEAHLWDNSCRREGQSRKGRQGDPLVHLKKEKKKKEQENFIYIIISILGFHVNVLACESGL